VATYTFTCEQDHDPIQMIVDADSDETAMTMMIKKEREHLLAQHTDMAALDDTHIEEMIRNGWQKTGTQPQPM